MAKMGIRDTEYISDRLYSPCAGAMEAHGRLTQVGEHEAARKLMEAIKTFTDECREVRLGLFFTTKT